MEAMHRFTLFVVFALTVAHCYGAGQVQMPEAAELLQPEGDLQAQVRELQKNVTDIWNYILELRSAVTHHLTHLRQHQVEMESSMHRMEHYHESDPSASSAHHHSGEQHSHSDDYHSHGDEHSHGSDHGHSHSGEHSHGSDHGHSHSGEQHSHSGEQHSHSGEHHSHSDEHHGHYSHSHSHSSHDHGSDDSHSHGHEHKDSHESDDFQQQTQQVEKPVAEPIVTATNRQEHYHHHHHQSSRSGSTDSLNLLDDHSHHHHHGHHHDSLRSRNKTVELPRVSDYGLYDLATCRMLPNSALPEDQQQNVVGTVTMWQKKTGGPVNFHVRLQGFDVGGHHGHHQQQSIQTEEDNETPQPVIHRHGFHIHASGDLSNGCQSTGPHYNPKGLNHGGPFASTRHVGDLGNIECDEHGNTNILFSDSVVSLRGQYSIIGKAVVIHEQQDDLGQGGNDGSLQHGNAGPRISCCVIEKIEKLPFRQYKLMKTATQYKNQ